jgi:hypothetical protein
MLADGFGDRGAQVPLARHDQSMLIQPTARELQQPLAVACVRDLIAQHPHQRPEVPPSPSQLKIISVTRLLIADTFSDFSGVSVVTTMTRPTI